MRGWGAVALVLALSGAFACGGDSEPWATEADTVVAAMAEAYDVADAYQTARFYSAGGSLDLEIWDVGVATTPEQVVELVERLWFFRGPEGIKVSVVPEHVFLSPDGALVWWYGFDLGGIQDWVQSYVFSSGGRTASRAFNGLAPQYEEITPAGEKALALFDRYLEVWNGTAVDGLGAVYSPDVVVRDDLRELEWRGLDELASLREDAPPIESGPWPAVFLYEVGNHIEAIVVVQLAGDCPMLEARRWVFDGDVIVNEIRAAHVPSVRRCRVDLSDGWWTSFVLPPELEDNVTEIIDAGGSLVDLVNAEPAHEEFTRWLFRRYVESGLGLPEVAAMWFPPSPDCTERGGLAIEADERYEGDHTVVVCFESDRLASDGSASGWFETAAAYGLHELAHIWMLDHLDDETRAAFTERAGLQHWRSGEAVWRDRGVEHAAFTIAWGLAGTVDARYPIFPPPECDELVVRYELLTGRTPITTCEGT